MGQSPNTSGAAFSTNDVHKGAFIVYINGIEVPCKSVSVRYGVWQIPEMTLEMVADPVLTRLGAEDRIQCAVFYLDDTKVDPSVKPQFRLMCEGEITGWGYQNTPSGRSINLTCVNQFAIFTQLFVQFLTNLDDIMGYQVNNSSGVISSDSVTSSIVFPFSLFSDGLFPIPATGKATPAEQAAYEESVKAANTTITRPFDFLFNVVKNMIGTQVPADDRCIPATNFFARWARLTNFHNRFTALPFFDETRNGQIFPVLSALQDTAAVDIISKSLIPQVQNAGSLLDILQLVYQTMLMEIAMIPTAPMVEVDLATSHIQITDFDSHTLIDDDRVTEREYIAEKPLNPLKPYRLVNYFAKPQCFFGLPPTCNVIFPSQLQMFAYDENYATQATRLYLNDGVLNSLVNTKKADGNPLASQVILNALSTAFPEEADIAHLLGVRPGTVKSLLSRGLAALREAIEP